MQAVSAIAEASPTVQVAQPTRKCALSGVVRVGEAFALAKASALAEGDIFGG